MREAARIRLHESHATAVAWLPDGGLLSAGLDARLWRVGPDLGRPPAPWTGPGKGLHALALDPAGGRAVTGDLDGALHVWDLEAGTCGVPVAAHDGPVRALAWTPELGLVSGGLDGAVRQWRLAEERLEPVAAVFEGEAGTRVHALAARGGTLVAAGPGPLRLWRDGAGREWTDLGRAVAGVALSPDGARVAAVDFAGHLLVRAAADGAELARSERAYAQAVVPLAYSADGARIAVGGDGRVRVVDALTLHVLGELRRPPEFAALAWSGGRLAAAGSDGAVLVAEVGG